MSLKKHPYFVIVFFISVLALQAQKTKFGIVAGPNFSTIVGDLTESDDPRIGYHFGVFAEVPISKRFSFNPELLYSSIGTTSDINTEFRGTFEDPNAGTISFKSAQRANYLTIPLAVRFNFTERFAMEAGPQVAFLINSVNKIKEYEGFEPENQREFFSGDFKLDFGATFAIRYDITNLMSLRLRYYHGIRDLFESEIDNFARYNRALQLSIGYIVF